MFAIVPILLLYASIIVVIPMVPEWARVLLSSLYLLLIVYHIKLGFDVKAFEKLKESYPDLTFASWRLNVLMFFVCIPLCVVVVLVYTWSRN